MTSCPSSRPSRDANKARTDAEFDASSRLLTLVLSGLAALAVLVLVMVWLARRTHRYLNPSMFVGSLVVLAALGIGIVTLAGVGSQVQAVRNSSFAYTVKLADARTAAYDAKSNESLTLIARGSGSAYEKAWQARSANVLSLLGFPGQPTQSRLRGEWSAYKTQHEAIRKADDGGDWDGAVKQALEPGPGSANAAFSTFVADADKGLQTFGDDTEKSLLGPVMGDHPRLAAARPLRPAPPSSCSAAWASGSRSTDERPPAPRGRRRRRRDARRAARRVQRAGCTPRRSSRPPRHPRPSAAPSPSQRHEHPRRPATTPRSRPTTRCRP